ncbi:MAG: hypothetical protein ABI690_22340 [Chloroflexota bacterium]
MRLMTIALAATYNPRGEIPRLQRIYSHIQGAYSNVIISLPSSAAPDEIMQIKSLPGAQVIVNEDWSRGRYVVLQAAFEMGADHIHYADLDRLIRWIETRPDEWQQTLKRLQQSDCLVIGRTEAAWATHPQVMIQVEKMINSNFSYLLGQDLDFGAGSKSFSHRAAGVILANSQPQNALGTDVEWPILLHRTGFKVESLLVDGLDWEIPDQYQDHAADLARQQQIAVEYDAELKNWTQRVNDTVNVFGAGLDALQRELTGVK